MVSLVTRRVIEEMRQIQVSLAYARATNCHEPSVTSPDFTRNNGLLPAIAQDADTGEVLMLAWMNREAYEETAAHRPGRLLQPQPQQALAQGRGERPRPGGAAASTSTATPTPCCSRSSRSAAPPATRATRAASSARSLPTAASRSGPARGSRGGVWKAIVAAPSASLPRLDSAYGHDSLQLAGQPRRG